MNEKRSNNTPPRIKVRQTKKPIYETNEDMQRTLREPAEFALVRGDEILLRILRMDEGWRACQPTNNSVIGFAVSPVGLNSRVQVTKWAKDFIKSNEKAAS